jgi:hypothetical protein
MPGGVETSLIFLASHDCPHLQPHLHPDLHMPRSVDTRNVVMPSQTNQQSHLLSNVQNTKERTEELSHTPRSPRLIIPASSVLVQPCPVFRLSYIYLGNRVLNNFRIIPTLAFKYNCVAKSYTALIERKQSWLPAPWSKCWRAMR